MHESRGQGKNNASLDLLYYITLTSVQLLNAHEVSTKGNKEFQF